jgi:GNAT superfamily N-acetyltransferase
MRRSGTVITSSPGPQSCSAAISRNTARKSERYVRSEHRCRGLARALVDAAVRFIAETSSYEQIYPHTDTRVPGAEAFWRSVAIEVRDARDGDPDHNQTVHFEIPLPVLAGAVESG